MQAKHSWISGALVIVVLLAIAGSVPRAQAGTTRYVTSSGGDDTTAINNMINISAPGDTVYLNAGMLATYLSLQAMDSIRQGISLPVNIEDCEMYVH